MRRSACLLALTVLLAPVPAHADDALRSQAAAALTRYYQESLGQPPIGTGTTAEAKVAPPPWVAPIKQLAAAKAEDRQKAAAQLRELVAVAGEQEQSGVVPWRALPFWDQTAEFPARDLRKTVAEELAKAGPLPDALPALRWYLENERVDEFLEPVMAALGKLDGKEANALRAQLASPPHENAVVAAKAIRQLAAHKGSLPAERVAALCHHHRAAIRAAARKWNAQRGGKDPGPFDAARSVRSEPLHTLIGQVLALMPDLPPAGAEYVIVTLRHLDAKKAVMHRREFEGWLLRRQGDTIEVFTSHGELATLHNGQKKHVLHDEPSRYAGFRYDVDVTVDVSVVPEKDEEPVRKAHARREEDDPGHDRSDDGVLALRVFGSPVSPRVVMGAWHYRAGRYAEAARLLLPAIDAFCRDRQLVESVRRGLGDIHGYRMLIAFAGDRDYQQALRHARRIVQLYPDSRFSKYAQGLAEQLPQRADDFTKLRLPTPAEWAQLQKKLTRAEQIDFLCQRMRLLNCFQMGQPGGFSSRETQYAEPCGMAAGASWGLHQGKTKVINPETELLGGTDWFQKDRPQSKGLGLTLDDVPQISKYLRHDWYMPIVTFWRDFHPSRSLSGTRHEFEHIIYGLAAKDICKIDGWDKLTPAEIDREIDRINRWAKANAHKTKIQLEWEALREDLDAGATWQGVESRVEWLLRQKDSRAYDVMRRFLENEKTGQWEATRIFQTYLANDPARAKDLAPKFLGHKEEYVCFPAAMIVFQTGDKGPARKILGDGLATARVGEDDSLANAVDLLLKEGSVESRRQAARVFSNPTLKGGGYYKTSILRSCAASGMKEPYRFYLPLLDGKERDPDRFTRDGERIRGLSSGEECAREIVRYFAPDDPAVKEIAKKFPDEADQIPRLKEWLQSRIAAHKE